MTKLNDVDRRVLAALLTGAPTQAQLRVTLKLPASAVVRSLLSLKKHGLVELQSKGKPPRLKLLGEIDALKASLTLLGGALA